MLWRDNIDLAVKIYGQKIVVYFFKGEVGQGKIAWKDLCNPDVDPWDGIGLGGSQKCEVAYMDMMKDSDPRYEYEEEDVGEFIRKYGTDIEALRPIGFKRCRWSTCTRCLVRNG